MNLENHFLIAMPNLEDTFARSVIYVYEHNQEGAMGVMVNKPLQISLGNVLNHLDIKTTSSKIESMPVLMGGPVGQEHGFILHDKLQNGNDNEIENGNVALSASKETLRQIATGHGPDHFIVTLGYAGWEPGQLEQEITENHWLIAPFSPNILFNTPIEARWQSAAASIGVNILNMSAYTGHA